MFGLMVFGAAALYLGLMFFVVRLAWRRGRSNGGSVGKASVFALLGFLLVYLPVFWNHIPVLLAHRSMCAKDAGFKAYVTPDQWAQKNNALVQSLRGVDLERTTPSRTTPSGYSRYEFFGGALARETKTDVDSRLGVKFYRTEVRLLDAGTSEVLTLDISYGVGPKGDVRLWLAGRSCPKLPPDTMHPFIKYDVQLREQIK